MWQGVWYHLRPALRLFVNTVIIICKVEKKEVSHCSINSAHSILVSSPYYFLDSRIFTTISLWTTVVVFIHFIFNLTTVIKRWIIVLTYWYHFVLLCIIRVFVEILDLKSKYCVFNVSTFLILYFSNFLFAITKSAIKVTTCPQLRDLSNIYYRWNIKYN